MHMSQEEPCRRAGGDPIRFAFRVVFQVCIVDFRQNFGGVCGSVSRKARAVDDNLGSFDGRADRTCAKSAPTDSSSRGTR